MSERELKISGHLLTEEIGRGGFSRVFRATPEGGGPAVAVKVAVRPELVSALRTEGAVLRRLQGPRFVKIVAEHLDEDPPYFVLELCEGGDLRSKLEKEPARRLPHEEAVRLVGEVLEGMAFAHDEGVVHGDLKPDNILLDAEGRPKIADLGLSRSVRKRLLAADVALSGSLATEDDKIRGTFDYLAPEVRGGADLAPASDVFALGVLFYELLVGHRPLGAFKLPSVALSRERVAVPEWLDRIVARSLAHDTRERYPDAAIMLEDLRAGPAGIAFEGAKDGAAGGGKTKLVRQVNDFLFLIHVGVACAAPLVIVAASLLLIRAVPAGARPLVTAASVGVPMFVVMAALALALRRVR